MQRKHYLWALALLVSVVACEEKDKESKDIEGYKASEIVNNPATAEEEETEEAGSDEPKQGLPSFAFEETEYNFGQVYEGQKVEKVFKFTNSGTAPLLIQNAKASCGCTVPSWPKNAIGPGESEEIKVVFDSKGKMGNQRKTITITANTDPNVTTLVLAGEVLKGAPADGPMNEEG